MGYTERGVIRDPDAVARLRDFSGLRFGKITPTDIDAFMEFWDKAYVVVEAKWAGTRLPFGQRLAFERLVDDLGTAGKRSLLLVVEILPTTPVPTPYAELLVTDAREHNALAKIYVGMTCRQAIERFLAS